VETPVALEIYWTSWCSWCKKEMAELDQAYDYLIERGVTVVAIQVDSPDTGRIYNFQMVRGNLPRGIASVPYHRILVGTDLAYESLGYEAPNKLIKRALSVVNNE
jgi:peroxiredoxin